MSKNKRFAKNEFRYNKNTKHINYVFEEDGKKYHSVGITHQKQTLGKNKKWHNNMPLKKNPQLNKTEQSYIRYGIITDKKASYGKKKTNFLFGTEDFPSVKIKIRNFKNQRRKK